MIWTLMTENLSFATHNQSHAHQHEWESSAYFPKKCIKFKLILLLLDIQNVNMSLAHWLARIALCTHDTHPCDTWWQEHRTNAKQEHHMCTTQNITSKTLATYTQTMHAKEILQGGTGEGACFNDQFYGGTVWKQPMKNELQWKWFYDTNEIWLKQDTKQTVLL